LRDANAPNLEAAINKRIDAAMQDFSGEFSAERKKQQAMVDTEEEYARISACCEGQLAELVKQRLELLGLDYSDPADGHNAAPSETQQTEAPQTDGAQQADPQDYQQVQPQE
jgi:hypothetical protein